MSHLPVLAEQLTDPAIAAALREHREDRQALLFSLTTSLQADPRVRAAWLWGSFGRGEANDLSDLDPWVIVSDEAVPEMGPSLRLYAERAGNFIMGGEKPRNAPPAGGYFSSLHEGRHGLLHLDCYWQPQAAVFQVPTQGLLFDRLNEVAASLPQDLLRAEQPQPAPDLDGPVEHGLGFAWLMFSIAAKSLGRNPGSDLGLVFYPKPGLEEAAVLLAQGEAVKQWEWSVPEEPLEKVERLRQLVGHADRLRLAANVQGYNFSPLYAPCLLRYLDMVEAILRADTV